VSKFTGSKCSCGHPIKFERDPRNNTMFFNCDCCGWSEETDRKWDPEVHEYHFTRDYQNNYKRGYQSTSSTNKFPFLLVGGGIFLLFLMVRGCGY